VEKKYNSDLQVAISERSTDMYEALKRIAGGGEDLTGAMIAKAVIADIHSEIPIEYCPDCGGALDEVVIERFSHKKFRVDYAERKLVMIDDSPWELNDLAYHCPQCDSLNVNDALHDINMSINLEEGL